MPIDVKFAMRCPRPFSELPGSSETERFCTACGKQVVNLDAVPNEELEHTIAGVLSSGGTTCVSSARDIKNASRCPSSRTTRIASGSTAGRPTEEAAAGKRKTVAKGSGATGAKYADPDGSTEIQLTRKQVQRVAEPVEPYAPILAAISPDCLRENAFRVTGLSVTATDREVARHCERLEMAVRLGAGERAAGPMPLANPPGPDAIRAAVRRLSDVEARLVDEVLWFWPDPGSKLEADAALEALVAGEIEVARKEFVSRFVTGSGVNMGVALHNAAILELAAALDWEATLTDAERNEDGPERFALAWSWARSLLPKLVAEEEFWEALEAHVEKKGDPRLTALIVPRIRRGFGEGILRLYGMLATRAAARGDMNAAKGHVLNSRYAGWAPEYRLAQERAVRAAAEPFLERIRSSVAAAGPTEDGKDALSAAELLLVETRESLNAVDALLPSDDPLRRDARDSVADAVVDRVVQYGNATGDWARCVAVLKPLRGLPEGEAVHSRLLTNLEKAEKNLREITEVFGEGFFELPERLRAMLLDLPDVVESEGAEHAAAQLVELARELYPGVDLPSVVTRQVAFCLTLVAEQALDRALDAFKNRPMSAVEKRLRDLTRGRSAHTKVGHGDSNQSLEDSILSQLPNFLEVGRNLTANGCNGCGGDLGQQFMNGTYSGRDIKLCMRCHASMESHRHSGADDLLDALTEVRGYLRLALSLYPESERARGLLDVVKSIAKDAVAVGGTSARRESRREREAKGGRELLLGVRLGLLGTDQLEASLEAPDATARTAVAAALQMLDPGRLEAHTMRKRKVRRKKIGLGVAASVLLILGFVVMGVAFDFSNGNVNTCMWLYRNGIVSEASAAMRLRQNLTSRHTQFGPAVEALVEIGPRETDSVPALIATLTGDSTERTKIAVAALNQLDPAWREREEARSILAGHVLSSCAKTPAKSLLAQEVLVAVATDWHRLSAARDAVPRLVQVIAPALVGSDNYDSDKVIKTLDEIDRGWTKMPVAVRAAKDLTVALELTRSNDVVIRATKVLARIGPPAVDAAPALRRVAAASKDQVVKKEAAKALSAISGR